MRSLIAILPLTNLRTGLLVFSTTAASLKLVRLIAFVCLVSLRARRLIEAAATPAAIILIATGILVRVALTELLTLPLLLFESTSAFVRTCACVRAIGAGTSLILRRCVRARTGCSVRVGSGGWRLVRVPVQIELVGVAPAITTACARSRAGLVRRSARTR